MVAEATVVVIAMGEAEATAATVEAEATGMGKKKDVPRLLELPSTTDIFGYSDTLGIREKWHSKQILAYSDTFW